MAKSLLFLLLLFSKILFCQTLSGKIENINGEKVLFANIITKDSINASYIKEFVISKNGVYSITPTKQYKQLVIEVSANKYKKKVFIIDSFISTKTYIINFTLIKDTIIKLQEVIVNAKIRPFQIKEDTVSYNVSAYRDGSERKIQDVIKKLPGIVVNEKTGEIKYKGKSVETVKLDGEDLFASNYTIGTKNINVNMVEQVQAIENYSDNPLLKGIESGDKVALNLILKKKKTDFSGNAELGLGALGKNNAVDASSNLLGISKKYKSFATASYNNTGINNTPFDYLSYNPNAEQLKETDLLAKKYIPDIYFDTEIDSKRSNINNSFFGSYNAVFKIGKKINLKSNIYYLNDKITSDQLIIIRNNINGQQFITSDKYSIVKKPTQVRGDVEMKYNLAKKSLLVYSMQVRNEEINTSNKVLQNNVTNYHTSLKTIDNYFKQLITYTVKISEKKAFQFSAKHTFNKAPQELMFLPSIYEPQSYTSNNQQSKFAKQITQFQSTLLGANSKAKYTISLGANFKNVDFNSRLIGLNDSEDSSINSFQNNTKYDQKNLYLNGSYKFKFRGFNINPAISLTYLNQTLTEKFLNRNRDTASFLVEPTFSFIYKFNNYTVFLISAGFKQKPFNEDYFIENPVYISNRIIKENKPNLRIQKTKSIGLFYLINNLHKQFQLNIGANYFENKGNYFSNLLLEQNTTKSTYFFLPEKNKLLSVNFMIEKYVPFLQGTLRLRNDYSKQLYKNIINNSLLRNNLTESLNSSFFFKTAFDCKINFENTLEYKILQSKVQGGLQFKNESLNNNFKIIYKPAKRIFLLISTDYYLPNTEKNKKEYFFIDTDITYKPKNKIYDFHFKARNITNNSTFYQFDINDYSTSNFQTNLLPRLFIISVSRNF